MTNPEPKTVTLEQINAEIASEHCFTAANGDAHAAMERSVIDAVISGTGTVIQGAQPDALRLLTFCVLILKNGFTVTGQSACADPAKFNAEMGRKLAREDAIRQCWKLLGFRLRDQIAAETAAPAVKRYTTADIADLKWAHAALHEDPFGLRLNVWVKLKDGKEFSSAFTPIKGEHIAPAAAAHAIRAANGED